MGELHLEIYSQVLMVILCLFFFFFNSLVISVCPNKQKNMPSEDDGSVARETHHCATNQMTLNDLTDLFIPLVCCFREWRGNTTVPV